MDLIYIRRALEKHLDNMDGNLPTAWENARFTPIEDEPYQAVYVKFANPTGETMGACYQQNGYMQINLFYPLLGGTADAEIQAELIRSTFKRGTTIEESGVKVLVSKVPTREDGYRVEDRWMIPIKIFFTVNLRT